MPQFTVDPRSWMKDEGIKALQGHRSSLDDAYDAREFWEKFGIMPVKSGL